MEPMVRAANWATASQILWFKEHLSASRRRPKRGGHQQAHAQSVIALGPEPAPRCNVLILISDLHLTDETTAINVAPSAFDLLGKEIVAGSEGRGDRDTHLVLLGDIYDVVRTDYWLRKGIPRQSRPWGVPPGQTLDPKTGMNPDRAVEDQFKEILQSVFASPGGAALTALVKGLRAGAKVTYVIGNHDRVFNNFPSLQQLVRTELQVDVTFTNQVVEPAYGVAARHGHEWDTDCHAWEYITKVQKRRVD